MKARVEKGSTSSRPLIFGGTTEGHLLCKAFSQKGLEVTVCTATGYGTAILDHLPHVQAQGERMDAQAMTDFIKAGAFDIIIDATHPYATDVTVNIQEASQKTGVPYMRVIREETVSVATSGIRPVDHMEAAVEYLASTTGNILLATGSKELAYFCRLPGYRDRLYVRVLPEAGVIAHCHALGFQGGHIIAMQGPFSHELNVALLRQFDCAFLVTKSSGKAGGLDAKISAAHEAGAEIVLVTRQKKEKGLTLEETLEVLGLSQPGAKEAF